MKFARRCHCRHDQRRRRHHCAVEMTTDRWAYPLATGTVSAPVSTMGVPFGGLYYCKHLCRCWISSALRRKLKHKALHSITCANGVGSTLHIVMMQRQLGAFKPRDHEIALR
ncbi:hypothetical protein V7S43_019080 [Phytophthora oleae]|uniref:Uncharacterized protein n=1 Tax=Phytophthora oleae TaxID=2107226 RepID=A0ABD3F4J9_9STRA